MKGWCPFFKKGIFLFFFFSFLVPSLKRKTKGAAPVLWQTTGKASTISHHFRQEAVTEQAGISLNPDQLPFLSILVCFSPPSNRCWRRIIFNPVLEVGHGTQTGDSIKLVGKIIDESWGEPLHGGSSPISVPSNITRNTVRFSDDVADVFRVSGALPGLFHWLDAKQNGWLSLGGPVNPVVPQPVLRGLSNVVGIEAG
ncbi:hypothetical protein B0H17DRAFT_1130764 [Mycena rosella]|uniref:Galectin n=1 Tax=Mycena rosella TaxID=1033263 RepID=A0AAD7DQD3_MYCRO|nr:hypothetical protein B0H17DRAFT_1130764 [Mycena rosella]